MQPCSSLAVSRGGHLLATGDRADHVLYKFVGMGGSTAKCTSSSK